VETLALPDGSTTIHPGVDAGIVSDDIGIYIKDLKILKIEHILNVYFGCKYTK